MSKHRHDLGHEDHGAKLAAGTTRGIQMLLGLWIALTFGLVVYALVDGSRSQDSSDARVPMSQGGRENRATTPAAR
jgi:hypothetical protein